jgi:hypothetical protein
VLKEDLEQLNPEQDPELLSNYEALYRGGKALQLRLDQLLPKRPAEEPETYRFRKASYHFLPYAGPIVNYLVSWLFTGRMEMRLRAEAGKPAPAQPDWWAEFKENSDGHGTDLMAQLRELTKRALVAGRGWLLLDAPKPPPGAAPVTLAQWRDQGLDKTYTRIMATGEVLDWEYAEDGELLWVITKSVTKGRSDPTQRRNVTTERWTLWERERWTRYRLDTKDGEHHDPKQPITVEDQGDSPTPGKVPLVTMCLPEVLWLMNILYSPAVEQFRSRCALSWSLHRTCYAMRIFHLKAPATEDDIPAHGPALGMTLGTEESVSWDAPPADAFAPFRDYTTDLKDELYRIANQMALGVDNNAAAVGRSGESKAVDAASGEVVLRAYGMHLCEVAERVMHLAAVARGEKDAGVHCSGMDAFSEADVGGLVDNVTKVDALAIPSRTLHVRMYQRLARAVVPDASQEDHDTIRQEIEDNVTNEELANRQAMKLDPIGAKEPDGDEEGGPSDADGDEPPSDEELAKPKKPAKKAAKAPKKAAPK